MNLSRTQRVIDTLARGDTPDATSLAELEAPEQIVPAALTSAHGRRWLRGVSDLDTELASRLVTFEEDFCTPRRDHTLASAIRLASTDILVEHASAISRGAGAGELWTRLSAEPDRMMQVARSIVESEEREPAESTLYLLLMDPIDQYRIGEPGRASIATTGLKSETPAIRSLAAEYLFDHQPDVLAAMYQELIHDPDERVRGLGWSAGIRFGAGSSFALATGILDNERLPIEVRRSALAAIGASFDTRDIVDLLAALVGHPDATLATDAANLLYRLHRHPTIAMAAAESPHEEVREIGEFLLDPYRGSPAAGGSRPGDPTGSDVFAQLIRETEERDIDEPER